MTPSFPPSTAWNTCPAGSWLRCNRPECRRAPHQAVAAIISIYFFRHRRRDAAVRTIHRCGFDERKSDIAGPGDLVFVAITATDASAVLAVVAVSSNRSSIHIQD